MHGGLSNEDQLQVFQRSPPGRRKIVVATNVAEASITIPGIVYGNSHAWILLLIF
jgi:ATP-dependent RNA helicase DDX35